jgi:hypothetical protein
VSSDRGAARALGSVPGSGAEAESDLVRSEAAGCDVVQGGAGREFGVPSGVDQEAAVGADGEDACAVLAAERGLAVADQDRPEGVWERREVRTRAAVGHQLGVDLADPR